MRHLLPLRGRVLKLTMAPGTTASRSGFALLLIIACLLLVSGALVTITRANLEAALDYADQVDDVRRRWEAASLEQASLALATQLYGTDPGISLSERGGRMAAIDRRILPKWRSHYAFSVPLNQKIYQVVISDESAKLNINVARRLKTPQVVQQVITRLTLGKFSPLLLPTAETNPSHAEKRTPLTSWGQVVPVGAKEQQSLEISEVLAATESITLWGDGKLNLLRASDEVLFEVSRLVLPDGESRRWMDRFRMEWPERPIDQILLESTLKARERDALLRLLSVRSTAVSAWIVSDEVPSRPIHGLATRSQSHHWQTRIIHYLP